MKSSRGFTIVELIVTITILVILMTLVVARLINTQAAGRDQERAIDIAAIAKGLEAFYQNGDIALGMERGYYPGSQQIQTAASTTPPFEGFMEGAPETVLTAPKRTISDSFGTGVGETGDNPDGSYSDEQATALLEDFPYLYQPLTRDNQFCLHYSDCVKYNLYYMTERENEIIVSRSSYQ